MNQFDGVQTSFLDINREERFFCTLLAHGLLSSFALRSGFFQLLATSSGVQLSPAVGATEVYTEVAWLRDHWRALGDPRAWNESLEQRRIQYLTDCLAVLKMDLADIEHEPFYRTSGAKPKVVSPGRWPLAQLSDSRLRNLKWAFNAKPDFIFVSNERAVILEVKLESPPGKQGDYVQDEVQDVLGDLMPAVNGQVKSVGRAWLARSEVPSSAGTITWDQLVGVLSEVPQGEIDEFSRRGLWRQAGSAAQGHRGQG